MPLSDEQLRSVYDAVNEFERPRPGHTAALRAVEAAVRADQIEKDARLAETRERLDPCDCILHSPAAAIRAQLNGGKSK